MKFVEIILGTIDSVYGMLDKFREGRKIKVESVEASITNRHVRENPSKRFSEAEIALSLHNSSGKDISIGRVLIDYPKELALAAVYDYEADNDIRRYISPLKGFLLPAGKTTRIILKYVNNPLEKEMSFANAQLKVYTNDYRIMKIVPVKLYVVK